MIAGSGSCTACANPPQDWIQYAATGATYRCPKHRGQQATFPVASAGPTRNRPRPQRGPNRHERRRMKAKLRRAARRAKKQAKR